MQACAQAAQRLGSQVARCTQRQKTLLIASVAMFYSEGEFALHGAERNGYIDRQPKPLDRRRILHAAIEQLAQEDEGQCKEATQHEAAQHNPNPPWPPGRSEEHTSEL